MKNVKEEEKKILKEAKEKASDILTGARATVEKTIKEIKESKASKESITKYKKTFAGASPKEKKNGVKPLKHSPKPLRINYNIDMDVPLEISVRGMTKEDAWEATDKFLDKAILANYNSVRILHGKGSWILRNMLRENLKKDRRVKDIETPPYFEGGEGVTIAVLK
jgi:DNA mismatch repair protein MutS2